MADNDSTVQVEEEGVVTVDVTDNPELAGDEGTTTEATPEKVAKTPKEKSAVKTAAADEASAVLTNALKAAEETALAERRRADEAQRLAAQKDNEAKSYREVAESHELTILNTGIENAKRELQSAKAEWKNAQEAGEFDKAADAQEKLAMAAADLRRMETDKANYEAGAARKTQTEGRVEPQNTQLSAFETYVSGFAPQAQAWLRAHPECVPATVGGNAVKNSEMMSGHYAALAKNLQQGTPEYFKVIEEHTGYRAPVSGAAKTVEAGATDDETPQPTPKPKPRMAQPSAPVSRDPPNGQQRTTRSVTLTKDQQDAAKMSFPHKPPQEAFALYARNLLELEAEGKTGRLTH